MNVLNETSIKYSRFVTLSSNKMSLKVIVLFTLLAVAFAERPYLGLRLPPLSLDPFSPQIVGGSEAKIGACPHIVSLQRGASFNETKHFCAGTILEPQWILTAGHCVPAVSDSNIFLIKAGKHVINITESTEQAIEVSQSWVHERYEGNVGPYDIALLKLESPLTFTQRVQPIDLPPAESNPTGKADLYGWGSIEPLGWEMPDKLQHVNVPYVNLWICDKFIQWLTGSSPVHETNVCTGPLFRGISACSGDSGGPLNSTINGKNVITGIVSWGIFPCAFFGTPSVYTKVSSFTLWIQEHINKY